MQEITAPVLVVGSGPSGLVMALLLRMNGLNVRIIEKRSTYPVGQRGAGIHPRSLELFHFLGVLPEILTRFRPVPKVRMYAPPPDGDKVVREVDVITFRQPTPDIPYPNVVLFGQNGLEAILRKKLAEYNCYVELETELHSFEQHDDYVIAIITKKVSGQRLEEKTKYHWLVGADGAHGVVRKQLGLTFVGETVTGYDFIIGDIYVENDTFRKDTWYRWGNSTTLTFGIRPTDEENVVNFWISGPNVEHGACSATRENLLKIFYETTGLHSVKFGELVWIGNYRPNVRMVNKFGEGRAFVVGDAAHVHPPHGGQGMNSSVQDSFNLAWKLALIERGYSPSSLLPTYSQERIPVISEMLGLSRNILKHAITGEVEKSWKRDGNMNMLGVNYRGSPIVFHEGAPEGEVYSSYEPPADGILRAGDRAPDAPNLVTRLGDETRLFDIFKPTTHTVLIFADDYHPVIKAIEPYPQDVITPVVIACTGKHLDGIPSLVDKEGHAKRGYNIGEGSWRVVVIRPDGAIGAILSSVDGVSKYFSKIFV